MALWPGSMAVAASKSCCQTDTSTRPVGCVATLTSLPKMTLGLKKVSFSGVPFPGGVVMLVTSCSQTFTMAPPLARQPLQDFTSMYPTNLISQHSISLPRLLGVPQTWLGSNLNSPVATYTWETVGKCCVVWTNPYEPLWKNFMGEICKERAQHCPQRPVYVCARMCVCSQAMQVMWTMWKSLLSFGNFKYINI